MRLEDLPNYVTGTQLRAARALLNWNQGDLAKAAGISKRAVSGVECGDILYEAPTGSVVDALRGARIRFISEADGVGVVLLTPKPADVINLEDYRKER